MMLNLLAIDGIHHTRWAAAWRPVFARTRARRGGLVRPSTRRGAALSAPDRNADFATLAFDNEKCG